MPRTASSSPATDLRGRTIEWRKQSLAQVQEMISSLRKIDRELGKIYGVVKSNVRAIHSGAQRLYKEHEKMLDADQEQGDDEVDTEEEEDDDYGVGDVMSALENVPDADDPVEDARPQIEESLGGLITFLEEGVRDMIKEVDP